MEMLTFVGSATVASKIVKSEMELAFKSDFSAFHASERDTFACDYPCYLKVY